MQAHVGTGAFSVWWEAVEGEGVSNTLASFLEGPAPLATLRTQERVSAKCVRQDELTAERDLLAVRNCGGLSI